MESEDESLLAAHQKGEETAFRELMLRYGSPLLGYLVRMTGNLPDAEDCLQETFIRVHTKAHTFNGSKFKPWIYTIATHIALDEKRKSSRRPQLTVLEPADRPEQATKASGPDAEAAKSERKHEVRKAIESLPDRQRAALILSYYEGMTHREIAENLGCSMGSVKTHISRAVKKLSEVLPQE